MTKIFFDLYKRPISSSKLTKQLLKSIVVQSLSCVWLFVTPETAACQAPLSFTISQSLLKLMSTESVISYLTIFILYCPFLLPSIFRSIRVFTSQFFTSGGQSMGASVSASVFPINIELISFRTDWFDFLAVQGTLESLLQHHSLKTSVLQHLAFFYGPTLTSVHDYWKNHSFESVLESFLHLCLKWETDWKFRLSFLVCHVMLRKVLSDGLGLIAIVFLDRYQMTL